MNRRFVLARAYIIYCVRIEGCEGACTDRYLQVSLSLLRFSMKSLAKVAVSFALMQKKEQKKKSRLRLSLANQSSLS
jgi:hypothetical protein